MKYQKTDFKDLIICTPKVFEDSRGYFFESFHEHSFKEFAGFVPNFIQDNQSRSTYGVLRGLHFQTGIHAQSKLVRVIEGEVLDVVVDLRKGEPTYGNYFSLILSAANKKQLFVPKGMAHGFITLSEHATFTYKCDAYYNNESERGLAYNDSSINIDWILPSEKFIISDKDLRNLQLSQLEDKILF